MEKAAELLKPHSQYDYRGDAGRPGRLIQTGVYLIMEITLNG
jgi:hypothetical protein